MRSRRLFALSFALAISLADCGASPEPDAPRFVSNGDGTWRDTETGADCAIRCGEDGVRRCYPTLSGFRAFSNAWCSASPLFAVDRGAPTVGAYGAISIPKPLGPSCGPARKAVLLGEEVPVPEPLAYVGEDASDCAFLGAPASFRYFRLSIVSDAALGLP